MTLDNYIKIVGAALLTGAAVGVLAVISIGVFRMVWFVVKEVRK